MLTAGAPGREAGVRKILEFKAGDGAFLYLAEGFRIVASAYEPAFGGVGDVTLTDGVVD